MTMIESNIWLRSNESGNKLMMWMQSSYDMFQAWHVIEWEEMLNMIFRDYLIYKVD